MTEATQGRVTAFLGLCMRAGRIISGQEACVELIRQDAAALALLDGGAAENTRKRLTDACHSHGTPLYELSAGALGHAIGKPGRMVIALERGAMADKLLSLTEGEIRL